MTNTLPTGANQRDYHVDNLAPSFSTAAVRATSLVVTFDEDLAAANLANAAFEVKKTPNSGIEETVSLSGTPSISGATVTLTLDAAVADAATVVTVSYTRPLSGMDNTLRDEAGNEVASFTDGAVTNNANVAATGAPAVVGNARVGRTLTALRGDIADANGLPVTRFPAGYTFQWMRVDADGTSNLTDIAGETGQTYTLAAADQGKKVKVRVTFTDRDEWSESVVSDLFPTGTNTLAAMIATNTAPTRASEIPNRMATEGMPFSYTFPAGTFSDADSDTLTYTATRSDDTALPAWLDFNPATRTFAGTPRDGDVGTLSVKVTAADGGTQGSASDTFDTTVAEDCAMPSFGTRRRIWTGMMTVGMRPGFFGTTYGYDTSSSPSIGELDDPTFAFGGVTATINTVALGSSGLLDFSANRSVPYALLGRKLRLHVCSEGYDFLLRAFCACVSGLLVIDLTHEGLLN